MGNVQEVLDQIKEQIQRATTSQKCTNRYKCNVCRDTGWVEENGAYKPCKCYIDDLNARRWKKFGVNPKEIKPINCYEPRNENSKRAKELAVNYIKNFLNIYSSKSNSIAFLGQSGAGKTHLTLGIGKAIMENYNMPVIYMPYLEGMKELKDLAGYNTTLDEIARRSKELEYSKLQNKYINVEVLIIDDLFKDKIKGGIVTQFTEADMKHIYPIINQRYINRKITIFSSECTPDMLIELDEALGGRILEMCKEHTIVFKPGKENNYRLKDFI